MQHGGDTSAPVLHRIREQIRERDVPRGRDHEVRFLPDPGLDRVPLQLAGRMRFHAVLQEEEAGQSTDRGDRDG